MFISVIQITIPRKLAKIRAFIQSMFCVAKEKQFGSRILAYLNFSMRPSNFFGSGNQLHNLEFFKFDVFCGGLQSITRLWHAKRRMMGFLDGENEKKNKRKKIMAK